MINGFFGTNRFLSNFFPCESPISIPFEFDKDHIHPYFQLFPVVLTFPTVEHAYQAAKTLNWDDRIKIENLVKPGDVKRFAKKLVIRDNWEEIKLKVMESLLLQKFSPGTLLLEKLVATRGQELIEENTWGDKFWGECPLGVGENHLGKLLMKIRSGYEGSRS